MQALTNVLCQIALNVLRRNIPQSDRQYKKLKKKKTFIRLVAKKIFKSLKKTKIFNQTGGFIIAIIRCCHYIYRQLGKSCMKMEHTLKMFLVHQQQLGSFKQLQQQQQNTWSIREAALNELDKAMVDVLQLPDLDMYEMAKNRALLCDGLSAGMTVNLFKQAGWHDLDNELGNSPLPWLI